MAKVKKELEIYHDWNDPLYKLRFVGGGELPDMLKSKYTSVSEAEKQRDLYYKGKSQAKGQTMQSASEQVESNK